jgi:hypothetical protein
VSAEPVAVADVPVAPVVTETVVAAEPSAPRGRGRGERPERTPRPEQPIRTEATEAIGISGERLTRDEAFDLLRRTVANLIPSGDAAVRASVIRAKARELLTRDSESLSDRNFPRILKDAHDNDIIDLRRRGDDFEVARVAEAESVADQLAKSAISNAPAPVATAPVQRGMGPRGSGPRGRGGRPGGAPPADLLSIGVVGQSSSAVSAAPAPTPAPVAAPVVAAPVAEVPVAKVPAAKVPAAKAPAAKAPAAKTARKTTAKKAAPAAKAPQAPVVEAAPAAKAKAKSAPAKKVAAKKPRAKKTVARADA